MRITLPEQESFSPRELARVTDKHVATIWRWLLRGVRDHRLKSYRLGGQRRIAREDVVAFLRALNAGDAPSQIASPGPAEELRRVEDELDRLQESHLAFLDLLYERGLLLASGPLADRDDESLRGVCVYRLPVDEARRIAAEDPWVQAGRMEPVTFTWLARAGSATFGT